MERLFILIVVAIIGGVLLGTLPKISGSLERIEKLLEQAK